MVVIGGGIEGLATAWALTARGVTDVTVLERDVLASAGTGKSSGIVRCHYGVASLAVMAWRGVQFFEQAREILDAEIGFDQVGYVVGIGAKNVEPFRASIAAQQALGIETRLVDHDEVATMWPDAHLEDFATFAYESRSGAGDAYSTAMGFAGAARRAGATIRQQAEVSALRTRGGRVIGVDLADGSAIHAGTVVVAAGPWSVGLVAPLGIDLPVRAHLETILLVRPGRTLHPRPIFSDLISLQYFRTERSGELLVGNSDLNVLRPADPDRYPNRASEQVAEAGAEKFLARLPGLSDASLVNSYSGCFDVTPDFNPVISATDIAGLFVAAGFSGHGFKIAPAVGELMADLVIDGRSRRSDVPESDFRLNRFAEGALLTTRFPYAGAGQIR